MDQTVSKLLPNVFAEASVPPQLLAIRGLMRYVF